MLKLQTMIVSMVLLAGMAAAQPADIPAAGTTPGDLFYGLDRLSERLELAVASAPVIGSDELAAKVRANHAAERLAEARELAEKNRTGKVEQLMDEYSQEMNRSVALAKKAGKPEFAQRLKNVSQNQVEVLEDVKQKVPEEAQKGIETAIENSRKNREALELPDQAKDRPGKKPENPGRDLNITVEEDRGNGRELPVKPGKSSSNRENQGNGSGRIDLGKLPTEAPDSNDSGSINKDSGAGSVGTETLNDSGLP